MTGESQTSASEFALICVGTHPLDSACLQLIRSIVEPLGLQSVLLHVIQSDTDSANAQKILESAHELLEIPSAEMLQMQGDLTAEIHAELASRDYALLVLGTGGFSPGQPSTRLSQRLANSVTHSVLLVRPPAGDIKRMLICTSGGPVSDHLIRWGMRLAEGNAAEATFLHVASAAPEMYAGLPLLTEDLAHVMSRDTPLSKHLREIAIMADEAGVEAKLELRHGMVAEEIVRACELRSYDFIVLGAAKSPAGVNGWLLDQVMPHVLASVSCSILVVRGESK